MAKLSGPEILNQVAAGNIVISPFDEKKVGPNSYDLSLGEMLLVYNLHGGLYGRHGSQRYINPQPWTDIPSGVNCLDAREENPTIALSIPEEGFVFYPGQLYLGHTAEYTETKGFVPCIETTSSAARLGISSHVSAGYGDCNFQGDWVLEITVVHPVRLYRGMPICQIYYDTIEGEVRNYSGNYQGQRGPKASRMWKKLSKERQG